MKKGRHIIGKWVIDVTDDTKPEDIQFIYKGKSKSEVKVIKTALGDNDKQGQSDKSDDSSSTD